MTEGVVFREAIEDDLFPILALLADDTLGSKREDIGPPPNPRYQEAFDLMSANPDQLLAVADLDGVVVGCLQLCFLPGLSRVGMWRGQVEGVRVSRELRGKGVGHAFIAWAIEKSRERGCGLVQLTTDKSRTNAHTFYEELGFVASHEGMKLTL